MLDPLDGPGRVREEFVHELASHAPPPHLAEEHDEQRRGIGSAVVDAAPAERQRRSVSEAHLMEDPSRLLFVPRVDLGTLEARQRLQDAAGQLGIHEERHPCRQQRVPAEDGHEPRGAGSHHHALGVIRVEDAKCTEVLGAAGHHLFQHGMVRLHLRNQTTPLGQPLGRRGPLDRLPAEVLGGENCPVDDRSHLDTGGPLTPGRNKHLERDDSRCHLGRTGGPELHPAGYRSPCIGVRQRRYRRPGRPPCRPWPHPKSCEASAHRASLGRHGGCGRSSRSSRHVPAPGGYGTRMWPKTGHL